LGQKAKLLLLLLLLLLILFHVLVKKHYTSLCFFTLFLQAGHSDSANKHFSPSKIKQWAMDDLTQTVSWLESQEEKVGVPSEKTASIYVVHLVCLTKVSFNR
jgi:hypothetical protein